MIDVDNLNFFDLVASSCEKQQVFDSEQASSSSEGEKCHESDFRHKWK